MTEMRSQKTEYRNRSENSDSSVKPNSKQICIHLKCCHGYYFSFGEIQLFFIKMCFNDNKGHALFLLSK